MHQNRKKTENSCNGKKSKNLVFPKLRKMEKLDHEKLKEITNVSIRKFETDFLLKFLKPTIPNNLETNENISNKDFHSEIND